MPIIYTSSSKLVFINILQKKLKNHVISKQDEVPENSAENNAGVEGGTSTEPGTETQATEPISEATGLPS
jgi:hypothetical protein